MIDISNIDSKIASIPDTFIKVLDYLKDAEGNVLETNRGETDITAPLGIYRRAHPEADIFIYIDNIAKGVTSQPSTTWDDSTRKQIDAKLNKQVCYYLAYLFYKEFYKTANLEYYDLEVIIAVLSIYANSPKLCNTSVQKAVNSMAAKGYIDLDTGKPLTVDGAIGNGTRSELKEIDNLSKDINYNFRLLILHHVKTGYVALWDSNKAKFEVFLVGWFNRVDALLAM